MHQGVADLDTVIAANSAIDHRAVDWLQVRRCTYLIHQRLAYTYPTPIYDLVQRLMILPPERYADQQRVAYRFESSLPTATWHNNIDAFGNSEITLSISEVTEAIRFETWILVERALDASPNDLSGAWLSDPRLLIPSALTQPDEALQYVAMQLLASGKQGSALAEEINHWVYQHMRYAYDVTTIHTTAAEVLARGKGVCQDYAHLMLALCRLCNLPARYISGHMLGEGGTHAWVEVLVPSPDHSDRARVIALDPTHDRETNLSYLTISIGRDYYDVAPTSGTFRSASRGDLTATKYVKLIMLEYADEDTPLD